MPPADTEDFTAGLFGEELVGKEGGVRASEALKGKKFVGVYFSAHWCPPCRGFTPVLGAFYDQIVEDDDALLEIVFVSSDSSNEEFKEYYGSMPWLALPFSSSMKSHLSSRFAVSGIPKLVILDGSTGEIKSLDGRGDVLSNKTNPSKCISKWEENEPIAAPGDSAMGCNIL